jgi:hypothetical protein
VKNKEKGLSDSLFERDGVLVDDLLKIWKRYWKWVWFDAKGNEKMENLVGIWFWFDRKIDKRLENWDWGLFVIYELGLFFIFRMGFAFIVF